MVIGFCLFCCGLFAQDYLPARKAERFYEKGVENLKLRDFEEAEEYFKRAQQADPAFHLPYLSLIRIYQRLGQETKLVAEQKAYLRNIPEDRLSSQIVEDLAKNAIQQGFYDSAAFYLSKIPQPDALLLASLDFAGDQLNTTTDGLEISPLPPAINQFDYQYLPVLTIDGKIMIYTARKDWQSDENIVWSFYEAEGWSPAVSISDKINSRYNEGACTISANGRTLIFTACEGRKSYGNCDLYVSYRVGEDWSEPENLGEAVNSGSWDSQPSLSPDAKTLYFVSNRPGGQGGKDIWMSRWEQGGWTVAENLGMAVNTPYDETTPYLYFDNSTLFFASNGRVGMGGFDLFFSRKDTSWTEPQNLGYPINTYRDEVSLFLQSDGSVGFFAQEGKRADGRLEYSQLVHFEVPQSIKAKLEPVYYVTGRVFDRTVRTPLRASMEIVDLASSEKLYLTESDSLTGQYFLALPHRGSYGAFVEKKGYLFEDLAFDGMDQATDTVNIGLQPLDVGARMVLENIYFAFDSDSLNQNSREELMRVVDLLKQYPTIRIEISGHTDSRGSFTYNQELSTRRAKSVYDFLIQQGITAGRLEYKGYADRLLLEEKNPESARNRRIEMQIRDF
jgi:flagellar motor protein MotB